MATIIAFPARTNPARTAVVTARPSVARGSVEWARAIIVAEERLCHQRAEAKKRADARRRAVCPKPVFTYSGPVFAGINIVDARKLIRTKVPDLSPEETALARAIKAHDARLREHVACGERMEAEEGVQALADAIRAIREDWHRACQTLDEHREDIYR